MMSSRSWTRITLSPLVSIHICILILGCAPAKTLVWIDNDRVRAELAERAVPFQDFSGTTYLPAFRTTLPTSTPSVRGREQIAARRAEAVQLMLSQRSEVEATLEAAFAKTLVVAAEAEIAAMRKSLAEEAERRLAETQHEISLLFLPYAASRGKTVARLSLIAGYPVPRSVAEEYLGRSALERAWRNEANRHVADLLALEAAFSSSVDLIAARGIRDMLERTADANSRIEVIRGEVSARAATLAKEHMLGTRPASIPPLLGADVDKAGPLPAHSVEMSVLGTTFQQVPVPAPLIPSLEGLATQVEIFTRVRGYKLAGKVNGAKDKTAEFLDWLKRT